MRKALLLVGVSMLLAGCGKEEPKVVTPPVDIASSIMEEMSGYVKFQDRMSMDWGSEDSWWLEKCAEYHGGSVEDKCYTMLVILNKAVDERREISDIVMEELYDNDGIDAYEFEEIVPSNDTKEALKMIMKEGFSRFC